MHTSKCLHKIGEKMMMEDENSRDKLKLGAVLYEKLYLKLPDRDLSWRYELIRYVHFGFIEVSSGSSCNMTKTNFILRGYCTPDQFFACLCIFLKNYNKFFSRREYNLTLPAISVACPKLAQSQYNVLLNFICVWVRVEVKGEFISLTDTADDSHTIHRV